MFDCVFTKPINVSIRNKRTSIGLSVIPFADPSMHPESTMEPDLFAIMLDENNNIIDEKNIVFYNNVNSKCGSVYFSPEMEHCYEYKLNIDWHKIPSNCKSIELIIGLYANDLNEVCLSQCHQIMFDINSKSGRLDECINFEGKNLKGSSFAKIARISRTGISWKMEFVPEPGGDVSLFDFLNSKIINDAKCVSVTTQAYQPLPISSSKSACRDLISVLLIGISVYLPLKPFSRSCFLA